MLILSQNLSMSFQSLSANLFNHLLSNELPSQVSKCSWVSIIWLSQNLQLKFEYEHELSDLELKSATSQKFNPFSARAILTVWPISRKRLIMQLWMQWTLTTRHIQIQTVLAHKNHTLKFVIGRDFKKSKNFETSQKTLNWFKISNFRGRVERRARQFQTMLKNVFDTSADQIEVGRPCLTGFGRNSQKNCLQVPLFDYSFSISH